MKLKKKKKIPDIKFHRRNKIFGSAEPAIPCRSPRDFPPAIPRRSPRNHRINQHNLHRSAFSPALLRRWIWPSFPIPQPVTTITKFLRLLPPFCFLAKDAACHPPSAPPTPPSPSPSPCSPWSRSTIITISTEGSDEGDSIQEGVKIATKAEQHECFIFKVVMKSWSC
ncbi:hypothetical protein BDA96_04G127600 [Sorghum bicolor]|uniref:Uncharacterized protein n=1 Tax=Sorghum bicolor TaxID=4558 RepID=A0A921UIU6_SORBI|nr:hypothetical protein BDA96_04G127600 [Sorghum bicolor]